MMDKIKFVEVLKNIEMSVKYENADVVVKVDNDKIDCHKMNAYDYMNLSIYDNGMLTMDDGHMDNGKPNFMFSLEGLEDIEVGYNRVKFIHAKMQYEIGLM